jgi:hypothetical protein
VNGLTPSELAELMRRDQPETCLVPPNRTAEDACLLKGYVFNVDYSLYNFVRTAFESDAYSYAVFPRGDVAGESVLASLGAALQTPEGAPVGAGLETWRESAATLAEQRLVNFAGSAGQSSKDFDFGWAFVGEGLQQPDQISQLALVSVPAYLDELELEVETGWLDRNSDPIGPLPQLGEDQAGWSRKLNRITVSLPPDYEALDTLVVGGVSPRGPWIDENKMDDEIVVTACAPASILIPGDRLWRSTTVTLGADIAERITVMPDMRGIVASFTRIDRPTTGAALPLTVWTSEGSITAEEEVEVRLDDAACQAASKG